MKIGVEVLRSACASPRASRLAWHCAFPAHFNFFRAFLRFFRRLKRDINGDSSGWQKSGKNQECKVEAMGGGW